MHNIDQYHIHTSYETTAAVALTGVLFLFLLMIFAAGYILTSILLGQIFKKAKVPQWAAWVPMYNLWKFLVIGDQRGLWAILGLLPFINIVSTVFIYIAAYRIGKKLGKEDWFVLLAIFVPVVWLLWLALDNSKWRAKK
ncbi:MAG: hypothetical protein H6797_01450 [Candidatus Nomurabacteria bacterium]|nr:MAG: hypothetical protein H6797_01450 [Candidatus Nomurabacteria bacterium]